MTAILKGTSASQTVPAGSTVRLIFGETHAITNDDAFLPRFQQVYSLLPQAPASLFTISRSTPVPGQTSYTVDARTHATRTAGEIVAGVETLCGYFVELRSLELLTPAAAKSATTPEGARARDDAAAKSDAQTPTAKFFDQLTGVADTAKWVAIAVLFVGLLLYAGILRKRLA